MNCYFLFFGVVIVLMLFAARKESGKRVVIEKVDHGHIVHWQTDNTTMLRSTSNTTRVKSVDISNEASADVQNKVVNVSNILWSRNWHNLVTCSTVPESYYNAATEKRHSAQEMMKYFSGCGGPLWVRLNTDHKNAKNNDITTFATHVLPKMKKAFVLITTDGDNSVPSNIDKAQDILDSPLCKAWYTQNYDGSLKHSKLKPIPIGFDLHTNWKGLWTDNVSENLEKMLELRANSLERTRDAVPFVPPWGASHHERIRSDNALECLHHVHGNRMGIDKLWDTYGSKTFALSPQGNGLDCHRTWELLFFGVIPIVKSVGGLDAMYKDLPVVIVKDWTDVCAPKFFVNERERLKDKWPMSLDKFQLDYWVPPENFSPVTSNVVNKTLTKKTPDKKTIGREQSLNEINIDIDATACRDFHRVGDAGDGGWWTCDFDDACVVYSFGIRDNYSFDKTLTKRGCKVHGFDPSKAGLASKKAYESIPATYHSFGIGGEDRKYRPGEVPFEWPGIGYLRDTNSDEWQLFTLPTIMKTLGHSNIDILKIDVEGSEWSSLPGILETDWSQLLIELHFPPNEFELTKTPSGVHIGLKNPSSRVPTRLSLIRKLMSIATLWHVDFNGKHCLEMSWKRDVHTSKLANRGKWLDVFHVNHEEAIWKMRFEEYWDFVDEFHVFECEYTDQGSKKPLYFANRNPDIFSKYESKIRYHVIPPPPDLENCRKGKWECEHWWRHAIGNTMNSIIERDDILLFSDADEIASAATLKTIAQNPDVLPVHVNTPVYKYSFHWKQHWASDWSTLLVGKGSMFKAATDWNKFRQHSKKKYGSGWHASTFGSIQQIITKSKSIIEGTDRQHSVEETSRRVQNGWPLWNEKRQFTYIEKLSNVPKLAKTDQEYFEQHMMRYGKNNR